MIADWNKNIATKIRVTKWSCYGTKEEIGRYLLSGEEQPRPARAAEHPRPGSRPHPRLRGLPSDSALEANPAESVAACELDGFRGLTRAWIWVREASLQNPNK